MIRRINLFGGPGSGKSSIAADLFSCFKRLNRNIELVREYVKDWAYRDIKPQGFDQLYITCKQMHREEIPLLGGSDVIITDSPLLLGAIYSPESIQSLIVNIHNSFERQYPSLNIFINRKNKLYNPIGRFQSLEQAIEIDAKIYRTLQTLRIPFYCFDYNEISKMTTFIEKELYEAYD